MPSVVSALPTSRGEFQKETFLLEYIFNQIRFKVIQRLEAGQMSELKEMNLKEVQPITWCGGIIS